jgi:FKBP-type peptidyl-prolyl cis-trans isomerase
MKKTALLLTALSILMLNACTNIGFNKTKSGLEYKIISGSDKGDSLKHGDIVKFEYRITF